MRCEFWCPGCDLVDGVTNRSGHVEAGFLGRGAGPTRPATQAGGSLEFGDQRLTFGAPLRMALGVAANRRSIQLLVEFGETASVLQERLTVEDGAGVGAGQRGLTRRPDQRQCRNGLVRPCDQLAQVPQPLQIRHVQVRAVELDAPDAVLRSKDRALYRFGLRGLPEELGHQRCGLDLAHLLRQRESLTQELRGRGQIPLLFCHPSDREERGRHRSVYVADSQRTELASKPQRTFPEVTCHIEHAALFPRPAHVVTGDHVQEPVAMGPAHFVTLHEHRQGAVLVADRPAGIAHVPGAEALTPRAWVPYSDVVTGLGEREGGRRVAVEDVALSP